MNKINLRVNFMRSKSDFIGCVSRLGLYPYTTHLGVYWGTIRIFGVVNGTYKGHFRFSRTLMGGHGLLQGYFRETTCTTIWNFIGLFICNISRFIGLFFITLLRSNCHFTSFLQLLFHVNTRQFICFGRLLVIFFHGDLRLR